MQLFCYFEVHDYMDMYPRPHVKTFFGEDEKDIEQKAIAHAKYMREHYSGGTTRFIRVMAKWEVKAHVEKVCAYEDKHPQPDSEKFKQNIINLFNECYN